MPTPFEVEPDIRRATLPPAELYLDPRWWERVRERVFARSWHWAADAADVAGAESVAPALLQPGLLGEPLVLTRDGAGSVRALSNVCTHRGALVCEEARSAGVLRCPYHGRRFDLAGRCLSMPEFEGVAGFPSERDHLREVPLGGWGPLLFAALAPAMPFVDVVRELDARVGWLPLARARFEPARSRDFLVRTHWALYCENYLEGFHIPFVHPGLSGAVEYESYATELHPWSSIQVARAKPGESAFEPPRGAHDHGLPIAGWYAWLFPATMINVYPWGLSVNLVEPQAPDATRVRFRTYVWDESRLDRGAGANLFEVELEDERVVESVQRGLGAGLRRSGRYSPARESGVHHFHRLLARALADAPSS